MTLCVILLDMLEICAFLKSRNIPVQILHPLIQQRIVMTYRTQVAFEVLDVNCIKSYQSRVKSQIQLSNLWTQNIWSTILQWNLLQPIQCSEDRYNIFVVCLLVWCEARFVDPRVEVCLHPLPYLVDLLPQMFALEVVFLIFIGEDSVEASVEILKNL